MATFYSNKGGLRFHPRNRPEGALIAEPFTYTLTANLVNTDVVVLARIPKDSTVIGYTIDLPAIDTHATPTLNLHVGDATTSNVFSGAIVTNGALRYSSWVSAAVAGGTDGADAGALPKTYSADSDFRITVTANANTTAGSGSTIKGTLFYVMQPFYSDPVL